MKQRSDASPILRRGFKLAGAPEAYQGLDHLMSVIGAAATTSIDIRCPNCPNISFDEHRLLGVIAARQWSQESGEAEALLAAWLPPRARRCAMGPAGVIAAALQSSDLGIRPRAWLHEAIHQNPAAVSTSPPTDTLH